MSTLLIDNYDSYTYNVFHMLAAASGEEPIVVHNDAISWKALSLWDFDAIVLSPGPGRPDRWHDFGVCSDILQRSEVPVLGICLGHQGLGKELLGVVDSAPTVMHGRLSRVHHVGHGLFEGIPQGFSVVRYHSLAVTGPFQRDARVTAWTSDGVVMGIERDSRPMWGVQFHPESISTEHGLRLFENFYRLVRSHRPPRRPGTKRVKAASRNARPAQERPFSTLSLRVRTIEAEAPTEPIFERLFGSAEHAFWLDSADAPTRLAQRSYMGTSAGSRRCILEYDIEQGTVTVNRRDGVSVEHSSIFDILNREIAACSLEPRQGLDRGLIGGFVGYLGYECKLDCGSPTVHRSDVPDAVMMLADRLVAVDHLARVTHLVAICDGDEREADAWLADAESVVREALTAAEGRSSLGDPTPVDAPPATGATASTGGEPDAPEAGSAEDQQVVFRCGRGRKQYLADIARCQAALRAGESYEVCLTDQITTDASPDPFELYKGLRRSNPAPFAAYLKLGEVAIVSSSPERFLSIDRERHVQARPIKGTARRSPDAGEDEALREGLRNDEKTFAENLMIVDLLRNDLGRVCEVDSVRVPELMVVESYPTVHQLISTVTGVLQRGRSGVECVRACFPGGSMTGAPKLRTMEIIDDIERVARGVYSGALGWFGLDGAVDLSIVIRTIVLRPGMTSIGAGGAIVMQSDPEDEFDEILLKARAPMAAIAKAVTGSDSRDAWRVELERERAMAGAR